MKRLVSGFQMVIDPGDNKSGPMYIPKREWKSMLLFLLSVGTKYSIGIPIGKMTIVL